MPNSIENLHNWLSGYYTAQRDPNTLSPPPLPNSVIQVQPKKEELMEELTGGWQWEKSQGKDINKPPPIRICTKCQGDGAPNTTAWCNSCREGKPGPGHEPEGIRSSEVSRDQDAVSLNKSFLA